MTLRSKLLLAQLPLAAALAAVGLVAIWSLTTLGRSSQDILKDNYRSVLAAQRMKEAIERMDSAALFLLADRPDLAGPQEKANRHLFETELQVQEANITEPGELEATQNLRALWMRYQKEFTRFEALPAAEKRTAYFDGLKVTFEKAKDAAEVILSMNQDAMVRKSDLAKRSAQRMTTILFVVTLGALVLGAASTTSLTSRLLRPLHALSSAVRRLGEGDVEARALVVGKDEISDLSRDFNAMAIHLAQYRRSSLGELLQAQQSSQAAIDSLPDPVIIFGERGEVLSANRAAGDLLGITIEVAVHDPLFRAPIAIRESLERVRAHVLGGKGAFSPHGFDEAVRAATPQGDRAFLPHGAPVRGEEGGVVGAAIVLQDVTKLLFFDQFKTDMVATVAHEFRTPLTSLHMAIHLCLELAAGPITDRQADLLHAAREDCERLQVIVNDLLDASRIQAGRLEVHRAPLRPAQLLKTAEESKVEAENHGLRLTVSDETIADDEVLGDLDRLRLVLSNLMQNALRYTPKGGDVRIRARPGVDSVRFEVSDTGAGIPREYHERVFEKYFQVPGVASGGAGLGLYISREVVLAHGGKMGVESESGQGSTFWFTIPKKRVVS